MMKRLLIVMFVLAGTDVIAEIVVPVRTIRVREIIKPDDLTVKKGDIKGAVASMNSIVGQEARVVLYAGRPVSPGDVSAPARISRNEIVSLIFTRGTLRIITEGRALGRGAVGETIRAMNIASRVTVTGKISADGSIEVDH